MASTIHPSGRPCIGLWPNQRYARKCKQKLGSCRVFTFNASGICKECLDVIAPLPLRSERPMLAVHDLGDGEGDGGLEAEEHTKTG